MTPLRPRMARHPSMAPLSCLPGAVKVGVYQHLCADLPHLPDSLPIHDFVCATGVSFICGMEEAFLPCIVSENAISVS